MTETYMRNLSLKPTDRNNVVHSQSFKIGIKNIFFLEIQFLSRIKMTVLEVPNLTAGNQCFKEYELLD